MKKLISLLLCCILAATLWGCAKEAVPESTTFPTAPVEAVPEPSSPSETTLPVTVPVLPAELAAFDQVFNGTRAITRAASGEPIMLSKISLFFTVDELPWGVAQVAVLDLDHDGVLEAVLEVENYAGYVILEYQEGIVFGTEIWHRAFQELKADGSFSGAGSSFNRYYWQYAFDGNVLLAERYETETGDPYYSVSGEETDAEAFAVFEESQTAKPAATWYPSWQDYRNS